MGLLAHDAEKLTALLDVHVRIVNDRLDRRLDAPEGGARPLGQIAQQVVTPAAAVHPVGQVLEQQHEAGDAAVGPTGGRHSHLQQLLAAHGGGHVRGGGGIVLDAVQGVREQVSIDDAENRTAQADGRVVAEHRPRGGVVEQDLPVDVAHDDRRGEFGHQRGQPVPLLREARLRGANLRVDLPFGDPAPLGQVVHRGGQLSEFGGSRPVQPVFGVGLEEEPGLGGQPPRRHGVATHQMRHRRDESGDNQRTADQQREDLACDCVDHGIPLIRGDAAPQQKRDHDDRHDNIGRDRRREQPATVRPSSAHLNRRRSEVG